MPSSCAAAGLAKCTSLPSIRISPALGVLRARKKVHEGRFAGAVGADEGVNLACVRGEVHALERHDAGVMLGKAPDLQQRRGRSCHYCFGRNSAGSSLAHQSSGAVGST